MRQLDRMWDRSKLHVTVADLSGAFSRLAQTMSQDTRRTGTGSYEKLQQLTPTIFLSSRLVGPPICQSHLSANKSVSVNSTLFRPLASIHATEDRSPYLKIWSAGHIAMPPSFCLLCARHNATVYCLGLFIHVPLILNCCLYYQPVRESGTEHL